jgi:hypothetical protein
MDALDAAGQGETETITKTETKIVSVPVDTKHFEE